MEARKSFKLLEFAGSRGGVCRKSVSHADDPPRARDRSCARQRAPPARPRGGGHRLSRVRRGAEAAEEGPLRVEGAPQRALPPERVCSESAI